MIEARSGRCRRRGYGGRISLFKRPPKVVGPDLSPDALGKPGEAQDLVPGGVQVGLDPGQPLVVLGVHRGCVDLVQDAVQHRLDPGPGALGAHAHEVERVVGAAPLPGRAGQVHPDRLDEASVRIGGDQGNAAQAPGCQVLEEGVPGGPGLARAGGHAQDLAVAAAARDALAMVHTLADDFAAEVAALCATTITPTQWAAFLDAHVQ